ncbi:MAG: hypothetical protein ACOX9B_11200 [Candidatus Xenobium sp.]|nr:hypothetical protein [Burkholderiales bacterium]
MKTHIWKKAPRYLFAVFIVLAMTGMALSATMRIKVLGAQTGRVSKDRQTIHFWVDVRNLTKHEYIQQINYLNVEVTGNWGNGRQEKYRRRVDVDWIFDPALGPGETAEELQATFRRKINPYRGQFIYDSVQIRVLEYNFTRAS